MVEYISSPKEIIKNNRGIFEVKGSNVELDIYLKEGLDLKEFYDYVLVANQTIGNPPKSVKMLHFVSQRGFIRFVQNGSASSQYVIRKWFVPDLKKANYSLMRYL